MSDERTGLSSYGTQRLNALEDKVLALEKHLVKDAEAFGKQLAAVVEDRENPLEPNSAPVEQVDVDALLARVDDLNKRLVAQQKAQADAEETAKTDAAVAIPAASPPAAGPAPSSPPVVETFRDPATASDPLGNTP